MENISSAASQFRPNHSPWLQNTLAEVDAKFKTILNLVEDDGETFAKRAEMYYHNKPQLIELLQDLHKSYRVLVENHDQLKCDSTRAYKTEPDSSDQIAYDLNNLKTISKSLTEDSGSEAADCGTPPDDELAVEVNDVEAFWDSMKSSVTLLRDNESVLVSFLRKYEEQRAEIRTLKSEVRFVRCLLDVERLDKEKRTSSIPKFKRVLGRLLSVRKK